MKFIYLKINKKYQDSKSLPKDSVIVSLTYIEDQNAAKRQGWLMLQES
jgi:hypothetical protein